MSETTVINLYKTRNYDVYIGRAGHGQDGYFGNPFSEGSREENIEKFREYFYERLKNDRQFRVRVHALKGKTLACFCSPRACHGDVIVAYLNKFKQNKVKKKNR